MLKFLFICFLRKNRFLTKVSYDVDEYNYNVHDFIQLRWSGRTSVKNKN